MIVGGRVLVWGRFGPLDDHAKGQFRFVWGDQNMFGGILKLRTWLMFSCCVDMFLRRKPRTPLIRYLAPPHPALVVVCH